MLDSLSTTSSEALSYESLAAGEGVRLFGDSWTLIDQWLSAMRGMDVPVGHKVWTLVSILSMISNHTEQTAFVPRLGKLRLNLGVMFVGHIQTVIENLILTAEGITWELGIPLAPTDTDGHRQGFIAALHGRELHGARKRRPRLSTSKPLAQESKAAAKADMTAVFRRVMAGVAESGETEIPVLDDRDLFEPRPSAMITPYVRGFLKDSYTDLTNLLVHCLVNRRIDVHLQNHRYLVAEPALSLLIGANPEDLLGRSGTVNRQLLANLIPVYNPSYYGSAKRMPEGKEMKACKDSLKSLAEHAMRFHSGELALSDSGDSALHEVGEARIMTTDVNLAGLSDRRIYHVFRIAGILAFSRRSVSIDAKDIRMAHTLLALNELTVESCYTALHAERGEAKLYLKLLEYVELHERVDIATLVGYLKGVTTMREADLVDSISRWFALGRVVQSADGLVQLNSEGARVRLEALTLQLRKGPKE